MRVHRSQVSQKVSSATDAVDYVPRSSKRFPARVLEPVCHATRHVILPALLSREALPLPAAVQHPSFLLDSWHYVGLVCGLNVTGVYVGAVA